MNTKTSSMSFTLTPIFVLIVTQLTALVLGKYLKEWVFLPIILIYWVIIFFILNKYGFDNIKRWLSIPQGHWGWYILAVLIGISSLPLFIQNVHLFGDPIILILHITFFLINPWLEEFYWRGLILDSTKQWPVWISILYSSILFTLWHSAFAWQSIMFRDLSFFLPVLISSIFVALIYKKTKSLWLCVGSHFLMNIFTMGIPVLLNLVQI